MSQNCRRSCRCHPTSTPSTTSRDHKTLKMKLFTISKSRDGLAQRKGAIAHPAEYAYLKGHMNTMLPRVPGPGVVLCQSQVMPPVCLHLTTNRHATPCIFHTHQYRDDHRVE